MDSTTNYKHCKITMAKKDFKIKENQIKSNKIVRKKNH